MRHGFAVAGSLLAACLLVSCGGGGGSGGAGTGGGPRAVGSACSGNALSPGFAGATTGEGAGDGAGDGGGGGAGGGDGVGVGGALGQFRGALVVATDQFGNKLGETVTDEERGLATLRVCAYDGWVTIEIQGRDGATYFDEATGQSEPFPAGKRLRGRVPVVTRDIGITPFTEAAAQLMDATVASGVPLTGEQISAANQRIGEVLSDQVPGIYRPATSATTFAEIDITRLPKILNESNARQPGTLTDTASGQYGAVNAGFSRAAGTFLRGDPSPTLTASEQIAADLADGRLDLQGLTGPVAGDKPPAYTYDSLWRAKTIGSGLTAQEAGDDALKTKNAPVAVYHFSASRTYQSCSFATGACTPLVRRTDGSQTVTLDARGILSVRRFLMASMGPQLRFISARHEATLPGTFVEVRVGTQGEVIALRQDRSGVVYLDAMQLLEVRGDEEVDYDAAINDFVDRRGVLRAAVTTVDTRDLPLSAVGGNLSVLSLEASPSARTYRNGAAGLPPSFLAVLSDGRLFGVRPSAASGSFDARWGGAQWIPLPAPEPLLGVVYDKYVPPGHDPAYGPAPSSASRLPFSGPRRLYGLTRRGEVKVWLEGESGTGRTLAIPGKVRQLAAESKASVHALTADGQVHWINADQAHRVAAGDTIVEQSTIAAYPRPFALNEVRPVLADAARPICWVANNAAVVCRTGEVFRWDEVGAKLDATADPTLSVCGSTVSPRPGVRGVRDEAYVSGGLGPAALAQVQGGIGPVWRINAVAEFDLGRQGDFRQDCRIEGTRYLGVNGQTADQATAEGRRNVATDLVPFPDGAGGTRLSSYITGAQLRSGLASATRFFAQPRVTGSSGPLGYDGTLQVTAPQAGAFAHLSDVLALPGTAAAPDAIAERPPILLSGSFSAVPGGRSSFAITQMTDGVVNRTVGLGGGPRTWGDDDRIATGSTIAEWEFSPDPLATCAAGCVDERGQNRRWQTLLMPTTDRDDPYGYNLCFRIRIEKPATAAVRFICSRHLADGTAYGFNLTDRVLRPSGLLELIDFRLF